MMFWKMYRRGNGTTDIFLNQPVEFEITNGVTGLVNFALFPGWYALDFKMQVANEIDGSLGLGKLQLFIGGELKMEYQASWPWTRHYIFMPKGSHNTEFVTVDFKEGDTAFLRYQNGQYFPELTYIKAIEELQMPKPLEEIVGIDILNGFTRYQSTGPNGTQIDLTVIIKGTDNWKDFVRNISNYYILEGNEGFYGGVILPQSLAQQKLGGDVYRLTFTLQSSSLSGEGSF